MKHAVLVAPGRFRIEDVLMPTPGAGEALVRITAVGVCGSDVHLFKEGRIGDITIADAGGPFVPGHECVGVVEGVGSRVDEALVGRRVFVEPCINCGKCRWCLAGRPNVCPHHTFLGLPPQGGCLAQYLAHPVRLCEPLGDEIDDDTGVLLEPLSIATHSLDRVGPMPGCAVAVIGAGPIGLTHVMLLARSGAAPLIVSEPLAYRRQWAEKLGATHTIDPLRSDPVEAVGQIAGPAGADFVFECAGTTETMAQMVEMAAPGGRVGVVGITPDDAVGFKHSTARRKGLEVLMIRRANLTFHRALHRVIHERLPLGELVTHHRRLEHTRAAYELVADYNDRVVKAVVNP